jgi:hypothetical protein
VCTNCVEGGLLIGEVGDDYSSILEDELNELRVGADLFQHSE